VLKNNKFAVGQVDKVNFVNSRKVQVLYHYNVCCGCVHECLFL